jgi:hypothetical protein
VSEDKYKAARQEFAQWFASNYPGPDTIIHDPFWHAPKVFRAALTAIERNTPEAGVAVTAPHDTPERRMKYHAAVLGVIARKIGYAETVRLLASIPEAQAESAPSEADVAAAIKRMWDGPGNVASWERAGANGAMGEREALLSELYYIAREKSKRDFLDVARAALIAEKVASEPVAWMTTDGRIATDETKNDAMANSSKAAFCIPLFAAPQQPAQSAEQDERAAFLSGRDVEELFLRWSEWTTELGEAISRKNIDGFVSDLRALLAAQPVSGADHD